LSLVARYSAAKRGKKATKEIIPVLGMMKGIESKNPDITERISRILKLVFFIRSKIVNLRFKKEVMLIVFLKGLIVGLGASIPLGPVGVLCIQKTLSKGRLAGFITGLGASISDLIYSALSLLGLFLIDNFIEKNKAIVLLIGGVVIILIGIKVYLTNPVKSIRQKNKSGRPLKDLAESLAITLTNPGSIFLIFAMLAAVRLDISSYSPEEASTVVRIVLVAIFLGSALWWFSLSTLVNIFRKRFRLRQLITINKIAGILIIVLGVISMGEGLIKLVLN